MKSNDAEVLIYLWDETVWAGFPSQKMLEREAHTEPPKSFKEALQYLRQRCLQVYRQHLWQEIDNYMVKIYGRGWVGLERGGGRRWASIKVEAAHEIPWRATENDWFKYPLGSRLLYFLFPTHYSMKPYLKGVHLLLETWRGG